MLFFRGSLHFPSTAILELLYVDNFMFSGKRSGSGSIFFQNCQNNDVKLSSGFNFIWKRNPIQRQSYWPIRVFIINSVNMYRVLFINSFSKTFIVALIGGFILFFLFNFIYFFTNTLKANFKVVFLLQTKQT